MALLVVTLDACKVTNNSLNTAHFATNFFVCHPGAPYYFFSEIRRVFPKKFCFLAISSVIAEVENP